MILINILEINQYFWISKNIDFRIDLAIDLGIDFETATFDQIWSNLIKFDQFWSNFPWFWSNLIKFDQIWSNCNFFCLCHSYWFSTKFLVGFLLKKPGSKSIKFIDFVWEYWLGSIGDAQGQVVFVNREVFNIWGPWGPLKFKSLILKTTFHFFSCKRSEAFPFIVRGLGVGPI